MTSRDELLRWLSETLRMRVNDQTVFVKDLGLTGLDLDGFFSEFAERYHIDMSAFALKDYDPMSQSLIDVWFRGRRAKRFTADHLLKVTEKGAWFDPQ